MLLIIPILFTACAPFLQKDGYYTGEKAVKMNYGVILASATAGNNFGSALYSSIVLVNINTGEKFDLQNKVCRIKKDSPGMGLLAQLFIEDKEDQIEIEKHCGSLLVGEIKSGEYLLKSVSVMSVNNAKGGFASRMSYPLLEKRKVTIYYGKIVNIGNIDIDIFSINGYFQIVKGTISMLNNYERDTKIFKRDYPLLEKTIVKDSSIVLDKK